MIDRHIRYFKDTPMYTSGARGASLHNLESLLKNAGLDIDSMLVVNPTGKLNEAWKTVVQQWDKDGLRYGDKVGNEKECKRFIEAMKLLHDFILGRLEKQGRMHNG